MDRDHPGGLSSILSRQTPTLRPGSRADSCASRVELVPDEGRVPRSIRVESPYQVEVGISV